MMKTKCGSVPEFAIGNKQGDEIQDWFDDLPNVESLRFLWDFSPDGDEEKRVV